MLQALFKIVGGGQKKRCLAQYIYEKCGGGRKENSGKKQNEHMYTRREGGRAYRALPMGVCIMLSKKPGGAHIFEYEF